MRPIIAKQILHHLRIKVHTYRPSYPRCGSRLHRYRRSHQHQHQLSTTDSLTMILLLLHLHRGTHSNNMRAILRRLIHHHPRARRLHRSTDTPIPDIQRTTAMFLLQEASKHLLRHHHHRRQRMLSLHILLSRSISMVDNPFSLPTWHHHIHTNQLQCHHMPNLNHQRRLTLPKALHHHQRTHTALRNHRSAQTTRLVLVASTGLIMRRAPSSAVTMGLISVGVPTANSLHVLAFHRKPSLATFYVIVL